MANPVANREPGLQTKGAPLSAREYGKATSSGARERVTGPLTAKELERGMKVTRAGLICKIPQSRDDGGPPHVRRQKDGAALSPRPGITGAGCTNALGGA